MFILFMLNGQTGAHLNKKTTEMAGPCPPHGQQPNHKTSHELVTYRWTTETRSTKKELENNYHRRPEETWDGLGGGGDNGWEQDDVAVLCWPMCCRHEDGLRSKVRIGPKVIPVFVLTAKILFNVHAWLSDDRLGETQVNWLNLTCQKKMQTDMNIENAILRSYQNNTKNN